MLGLVKGANGEIQYKADAGSADAVLEDAIEAGADDVVSDASGHLVTTAFDSLGTVAQALEKALSLAAKAKLEKREVFSEWRKKKDEDSEERKGKIVEQMQRQIAALKDNPKIPAVKKSPDGMYHSR
jgi:transcriptional/translational regulatory protein YebC/TACO1